VSQVEVQRRLDYADNLLRNGKSRADVVAEMAGTFGISTRAADSYIARVRSNWVEESKAGREVEREAALARLDRLSGKAEQRGQFGAAVSAEKLRAQVTGILEPKTVNVTASVEATPAARDLTEEECYAELAGLVGDVAEYVRSCAVVPTPKLLADVKALADALGLRIVPADGPPKALRGRSA
jgi:hypothetical protein